MSTEPGSVPDQLADGSGYENPYENSVVRAVAEDLRKATRRTHRLGISLVSVTALLVIAAGIGLFGIAITNRKGVTRIVSCTTPRRQCYEDEKARNNVVVANALIELNEEHLVIECILQVAPDPMVRAKEYPRCKREAAEMTAKARAQLEAQVETERQRAEQHPGSR